MMKVFKPAEEAEALQEKIDSMELEHQKQILELRNEIERLRELEVYKEKYLALKKIFDEMEKSSCFKDKELELVRREYELKMGAYEAHKENEYRQLA